MLAIYPHLRTRFVCDQTQSNCHIIW